MHESPNVMLIPLYVLAVGALAAGFVFKDYFIGHRLRRVLAWRGRPTTRSCISSTRCRPGWSGRPSWPWSWASASPGSSTSVNTSLPQKLAAQHQPLYRFLLNKWYFDELYDFIFVRPAMWLGRFLWKKGDGFVIDGFGPDGVASTVSDVTRGVVRLQTGYLYHYAFVMLIGVAALISWFAFGGAH